MRRQPTAQLDECCSILRNQGEVQRQHAAQEAARSAYNVSPTDGAVG